MLLRRRRPREPGSGCPTHTPLASVDDGGPCAATALLPLSPGGWPCGRTLRCRRAVGSTKMGCRLRPELAGQGQPWPAMVGRTQHRHLFGRLIFDISVHPSAPIDIRWRPLVRCLLMETFLVVLILAFVELYHALALVLAVFSLEVVRQELSFCYSLPSSTCLQLAVL